MTIVHIKNEDPVLTFFFTSIPNTNSQLLSVSEEKPLDQFEHFTDASLPPETRNFPFSPIAETNYCQMRCIIANVELTNSRSDK
jgi:hypothetical protein